LFRGRESDVEGSASDEHLIDNGHKEEDTEQLEHDGGDCDQVDVRRE
jgi:hypothetical protein